MGLFQGDGDKLSIGRAAVFFARNQVIDGVTYAGGERFLGSCRPFEIAKVDEILDFNSPVEHTSALIKRAFTKRTYEGNFTLFERDLDNLSLAFSGDKSTAANDPTPITGEVLPPIQQGTWMKLVGRGMTTVTFTPSATVDVDYVLDSVSGRVYIIPDSAVLTEAIEDVEVAYTPGDWPTVSKVSIGTANAIEGLLRFVGDPVFGKAFEIVLWKVQIELAGSIGLIGENAWDETPLKATVLSDPVGHSASPFGDIIDLATQIVAP